MLNQEEKKKLVNETIEFLKSKQIEPLDVRRLLNLAYLQIRAEYGIKPHKSK